MFWASLACAIIPLTLFLVVLRSIDRYEPEPWRMIGIAFTWGAVGAVFLGMLGTLILREFSSGLMPREVLSIWTVVFAAPVMEEGAKALALPFLVRSREVDNTTDGFIYGATIGLGFGMVENFLYFLDAQGMGTQAWLFTVLVRTSGSALMHSCATALVGAALAFAKFRVAERKRSWGPVGLLLAIGIHGLWNLLASLETLLSQEGRLLLLDLMILGVEWVLLFSLLRFALWGESKVIFRELHREARRGTLPLEHVRMLASAKNRKRTDWLPPHVNPVRYRGMTSLLAFRRHQAQVQPRDVWYGQEVVRLRRGIQQMLEKPTPPS